MPEETKPDGPGQGEIYRLLPLVMAQVGTVEKDRKHEEFKYAFRSLDDLLLKVQPAFVKHGVFCAPRVVSRTVEPVKTSKGKDSIHVLVEVEYRFYAGDGSHVTVSALGQSLDTQDKAAAKAQTSALKTALIALFAIPAGEAPDGAHEFGPEARASYGQGGRGHKADPPGLRAGDPAALARECDRLASEASALGGGKTLPEKILAEAIGRMIGPDLALDQLTAKQLALVLRKLQTWIAAKKAAAATKKPSAGPPPERVQTSDGNGSRPRTETPEAIRAEIGKIAASLARATGKRDEEIVAEAARGCGQAAPVNLADLDAEGLVQLRDSLMALHQAELGDVLPL